jgi:hypothetical protein
MGDVMTNTIRNAITATAFLFAVAISGPALADTFTTISTSGGDGHATFPPGFDVDLFGSDNGVGQSLTTYTATALSNQTFTVNWLYHTNDVDGPSFDPAGYLLDGVLTQLTNNDGPDDQSGTFILSVLLGQVYGLYVDSSDSIFGAADIKIAGAETPLPAALPLFVTGLGTLGLLGWRRKRKGAAQTA